MARYPSSLYGRRRGRPLRRTYIISALLIIAVVIAFIYGSSGENETRLKEEPNSPVVYIPPSPPPPEPNLAEITPEPTSKPNPKVAELIDEAMALVDGKPARIIEARDRLNETLSMSMNNVQRVVIKQKLSELAKDWLFSKTVFPQDSLCSSYRVKRGERLETIGKRYKVPWEILSKINEVRPEVLPAGETIKVINGPFHARVYLSTFTMDLFLQNNTFVKSFRVGVGKAGNETPTGVWRVKRDGKQIEPPWPDREAGRLLHPGDPDYPLGSRWIGLEGVKGAAKDRTGIGFHGWKNSDLMDGGGSRGCIRLHNGDVIFVYNLLVPVYSIVKVVE